MMNFTSALLWLVPLNCKVNMQDAKDAIENSASEKDALEYLALASENGATESENAMDHHFTKFFLGGQDLLCCYTHLYSLVSKLLCFLCRSASNFCSARSLSCIFFSTMFRFC